MDRLKKVDHGAMVANQIVIIVLTILAFVADQARLAAFVAVVMALGTLVGRPGFLAVYRLVLKPLGIVKPHVLFDNPEPHRFAQSFGAAVLGSGSALVFGGFAVAGWSLAWLVVALAALNAFAGFCAGCFMYYWLSRFRVPGFSKTPPEGTFPGMRPREVSTS